MQPCQLAKHQHVRVTWLDSSYQSGWMYPDRALAYPLAVPKRITSSGWIVASTPEMLTLAASLAETGAILNPVSIPWGAILELREEAA